jgi:hypothetical protein
MQMAYPPPKRDPKSGRWRFRKAVPESLRERIGQGEVVRWLGTDAATARKLNAEYHTEWEAKFSSLRSGITELTRKQALALAGRWYRWFTEGGDAGPRMTPAEWLHSLDELVDLEPTGGALDHREIPDTTDATARTPADTRRIHAFLHDRGHLARFFLDEAVTLAPESMPLFMEALEEEFRAAHVRLARLAGGDYSPDKRPSRFPKWEHPSRASTMPVEPSRGVGDRLTLPALFELWKAGNPQASPGTIKVYGPKIDDCDAFLEAPDARAITADDIWRWADYRLTVRGMSPKTVRDNDIAALKSVMSWATIRHRLVQTGTVEEGRPAWAAPRRCQSPRA